MTKSVYFFIGEHEIYNDLAIHLAEGLSQLGNEFYSNRNFWRVHPDTDEFLFNHDPHVNPQDCDIVVFTTLWSKYICPKTFRASGAPLPSAVLEPARTHLLALLDAEDGYRSTSFDPIFRSFDAVFRAKLNSRTHNFRNQKTWVHGFGNRVLHATRNSLPFSQRTRCIVQNFGFTHLFEHGARKIGIECFLSPVSSNFPIDSSKTRRSSIPKDPWDFLMYQQTVGKHNPAYYEQLGRSQCTACFCGDFIPAFPFDPSPLLRGGNKARVLRIFFAAITQACWKAERLIQWDSWRFWECLVAGSVAIHFDLAKYGVSLPVMPENWKHYIGLDREKIDADIERFLSLTDIELADIGREGRSWAMEHYCPVVSAGRFLNSFVAGRDWSTKNA